MTTYEKRHPQPGCVVQTYDAAQYRGDLSDIWDTFPDLVLKRMVDNGAAVVTDTRSDYMITPEGDWVVSTDEPGEIMILSDTVFRETYRETVLA